MRDTQPPLIHSKILFIMDETRQKRSRSFERKASTLQSYITSLCVFRVKAYILVDGRRVHAPPSMIPVMRDIKEHYWIHESSREKFYGLGFTGIKYVYYKIRMGLCGEESSITYTLADTLKELIADAMSDRTYKKYSRDTI